MDTPTRKWPVENLQKNDKHFLLFLSYIAKKLQVSGCEAYEYWGVILIQTNIKIKGRNDFKRTGGF